MLWQISAINKESMFVLKTRVTAFKTYLLIRGVNCLSNMLKQSEEIRCVCFACLAEKWFVDISHVTLAPWPVG